MKLESLLCPERTAYFEDINSRKALLERLSQLICQGLSEIDVHEVFESYLARERLGSTSLGQGVAIPHIRCRKLTSPRAAMVHLSEAIPFDDQDSPVDLVFALAVPEEAPEEHLAILSQLAKTFYPQEHRQQLRALKDREALFNQLCDYYDNEQS